MSHYEKYVHTKYEINNLKDENTFTLHSLPAYYKTQPYVPAKRDIPKLLPQGNMAPNYQLTSLTNEVITLSGLKGKLVLIDFFYKSCPPCMQSIPTIQALHQKYKDRGLSVIGIDPFNKEEEDGIETFFAKRGVTYTVLMDGGKVADDYHVSGYPTVYLVDKSGKVIFTQVGYSKENERTLEEIIRKNL